MLGTSSERLRSAARSVITRTGSLAEGTFEIEPRANSRGREDCENNEEGDGRPRPGVACHDFDVVNSGGAYRTEAVDVQPTTDAGGGFNVGFTRPGEWMRYDIDVAASGLDFVQARVVRSGAGGQLLFEIDGRNVTGPMTVPNTTAFQTWRTIRSPAFRLRAGRHVLRLVLDSFGNARGVGKGAVGNFNWLSFE
jgi:hypothetical protein